MRVSGPATEIKQRSEGLEIKGVTLHSYRCAWAEGALKCGYPERFAQQAPGHNSRAAHHACLEEPKVVTVNFQAQEATASGGEIEGMALARSV